MSGIKADKNDVQETGINDSPQNISVKMTFYFNIFKQSILDFENYPFIVRRLILWILRNKTKNVKNVIFA